jgi:hypothetical protein
VGQIAFFLAGYYVERAGVFVVGNNTILPKSNEVSRPLASVLQDLESSTGRVKKSVEKSYDGKKRQGSREGAYTALKKRWKQTERNKCPGRRFEFLKRGSRIGTNAFRQAECQW